MAIGDTRVVNGVEFEVVWDGGEGLCGDWATKQSELSIWTPPKRKYNKKSEFWKKYEKKLDNPLDSDETPERLEVESNSVGKLDLETK